MATYVNKEGFFDWYKKNTGKEKIDENALLSDVYSWCCEKGAGGLKFTLGANKTVSGKEEQYPVKFENIGCCGAVNYVVTFNESAMH